MNVDRIEWRFPSCYPARDCLPHDASNEPLWNESGLLHWVDLDNGLAGFHRFGYQPNRGQANYQVGVCTQEGLRFRRAEKSLPLRGDERRDGGYSLDERLHVAHSDGSSHWRFDDADCEIDLRLEEFLPRIRTIDAWGFENQAVRQDAADHYEVAGTVRGRVRVANQEYRVSCLGYRDHSWGNRSWSFSSHRWFTGSFGADFSFSIATAIAPSVGYFQGGYVAKDGIVDPMTRADVLVYAEDDGITTRGGRIVCDTKHFGRFTFEVETLDCVLLEADHHIGCEALSKVVCDGRIGTCDLESSNNPRDGRAAPTLILGAAVENGLTRRHPFRL
jgi:hypothetical protein